jgi:hypothetical protein
MIGKKHGEEAEQNQRLAHGCHLRREADCTLEFEDLRIGGFEDLRIGGFEDLRIGGLEDLRI